MIRRLAAVALTVLPLALLVPAVPASAGGGCHESATTGTGPLIVMSGACFDATITRVAPGEEVTFRNEDPMTHNVTANGWGNFDDMNQGDEYSFAFADEGIYPFACSYHPGMTGAIVVGDGVGAGNGVPAETTVTGPTTSAQPASLEDASPVGTTTDATSTAWPWLAGIAIGAAIGFGLASVVVRRRSATPGGTSEA